MSIVRKWDMADESTKKQCTDEVIAYIEDLEGAQPGVIAAQDIIDIVMQHLGPTVYNAGLADANKLIKQKLGDIETELDTLHQP
ncbi:DUF2164 family protein [Candidatus Saccharibacteria bacterium]|nr:DUF2164 family protein [Candidatus Saccharibacteria bacterium]